MLLGCGCSLFGLGMEVGWGRLGLNNCNRNFIDYCDGGAEVIIFIMNLNFCCNLGEASY